MAPRTWISDSQLKHSDGGFEGGSGVSSRKSKSLRLIFPAFPEPGHAHLLQKPSWVATLVVVTT